MSATLTSKRLSACFACLALLALPAAGQEVQGTQAGFSFFSFVPAKPHLAGTELDASGDLAKAQAAYRRGDFVAARQNLEIASKRGDVIANWYLGHMYRLGRGVAPDMRQAYKYYSMVVAAFDPEEPDARRLKVMVDALVRVADIHRSGNGGPKDPAEAYRMYNTAASFGHPAAHYALGVMSLEGDGVKANPEMALKWLMLAARKRYAPAEAELGRLYLAGSVVEADRVRALMWFMLAGQSADESEQPKIVAQLSALQAQVTESELADAEARARKWSRKYPTNVIAATLQAE